MALFNNNDWRQISVSSNSGPPVNPQVGQYWVDSAGSMWVWTTGAWMMTQPGPAHSGTFTIEVHPDPVAPISDEEKAYLRESLGLPPEVEL